MMAEIIGLVDAVGTLLLGLGAVGIVRRQKQNTATLDRIHAKLGDQ